MENLTATQLREIISQFSSKKMGLNLDANAVILLNEMLSEIENSENGKNYEAFKNMAIENVEHFSIRTRNSLRRVGILTVADLKCCSKNRILNIPNLGVKCRKEVFDFCAMHNITIL